MKKVHLITVFIFLMWLVLNSQAVFSADSKIDELKSKISDKNLEITEIEKEIEEYQQKIDDVAQEKKTLKNEISRLQNTSNKLKSEINLTSKKIDNTNLSIEKLQIEIQEKNNKIETSRNSLAEIIRKLDEQENQSLLEILLANNNLSDFFVNLDRMDYVQKDININLGELKELKKELEEIETQKRKEKNSLVTLNDKLGDQKIIAEQNKQRKNTLLEVTNNKEENYKNKMEEMIAKKEAFLAEIIEMEEQIRIQIDPASIPPARSGLFKYPLPDVSLVSCYTGETKAKNCITQFFGSTPFATKNPQVYGGRGEHNGVDFRASIGTDVVASLGGIVEGTGNTDETPGCYSYGKWILIRHDNGLSTIYAHLSIIKVTPGQTVKTGDLIGRSGDTGLARIYGKHLHFGVYATQGVKIQKFEHSINCKNAYVPIADRSAYLNPLSYL